MKKLFLTIMVVVAALFAPIVAKAEAVVASVKLHVKAIALIAHAHLFNFMAKQGMVLGANTLTGLVPTLYESLDIVSREMIGMIPAVSRNSSGERAALNQLITIPLTEAQALADNTPAVTAPNTGDQTVDSVTMTISKSKHVPIRWNGEEQRGQINAGTYQGTLRDQFTQAFRALANQIDVDLWTVGYQNASRAYGTPATAPFGTAGDLSDMAQVAMILDNNGAPISNRKMVLGSAAVANLRGKQSLLLKVNESGSTGLLRRGSITELPIEGFDMHNSAAIKPVTKGTMANATTNATGYAVGAKVITLALAGTGVSVPGDTVTFAGDTNKYVVSAVSFAGANPAAGDTITLAGPGLQQAIPAAATAITVGATATSNLAFEGNAIKLITRAPALPVGPDGKAMDMADDMIQVTDPVSGITFEIAVYRQFMQLVYHVRLAWGYQAIKQAHIATLLG